MKIDYKPIAKKAEQMLKDKIKSEGLVKTGRLLNSIKVISNGNGSFSVEAEDYFTPLDEEHNLSGSVFNSSELMSFTEEEMSKQIEEQIAEELNKAN